MKMAVYLVVLDLRKHGNDYEHLINELDRLHGHRVMPSAWLVDVTVTAKDLADHLAGGYMGCSDRIWIAEITSNGYFRNAMGGTLNWLSDSPPGRQYEAISS